MAKFYSHVEDAMIEEAPVPSKKELKTLLGNLLARIHRDGGHYVQKHGWEKATLDAEKLVISMLPEQNVKSHLLGGDE